MYKVEERWRGARGGDWSEVLVGFPTREEAEAERAWLDEHTGEHWEYRVVEIDKRGFPVTVDPSLVRDA